MVIHLLNYTATYCSRSAVTVSHLKGPQLPCTQRGNSMSFKYCLRTTSARLESWGGSRQIFPPSQGIRYKAIVLLAILKDYCRCVGIPRNSCHTFNSSYSAREPQRVCPHSPTVVTALPRHPLLVPQSSLFLIFAAALGIPISRFSTTSLRAGAVSHHWLHETPGVARNYVHDRMHWTSTASNCSIHIAAVMLKPDYP